MDLAMITFEQVGILFLLIFAGFIAVKTGAIKPEGRKVLSDLLVYLIMPCMILNSYFMELNQEMLKNLFLSFGLSTMLLLLAVVVSILLTLRKRDENKKIVRFACTFSNAGYMGIPLIQALYGTEGTFYASAFLTMFNILLWTVGCAMVNDKVKAKDILKSIASTPVLYGVVLGLVIYLLQIPVPNFIVQPVAAIGNMNTPISMIIIGMIIAGSNMKFIVTNKDIWFTIVVRMLLIPAISVALFYLLGFDGMTAKVVLIQAACPTAAITSVFAIRYGHSEDIAAGSVVLTTLCSIVTLPLLAMLLQLFI